MARSAQDPPRTPLLAIAAEKGDRSPKYDPIHACQELSPNQSYATTNGPPTSPADAGYHGNCHRSVTTVRQLPATCLAVQEVLSNSS